MLHPFLCRSLAVQGIHLGDGAGNAEKGCRNSLHGSLPLRLTHGFFGTVLKYLVPGGLLFSGHGALDSTCPFLGH